MTCVILTQACNSDTIYEVICFRGVDYSTKAYKGFFYNRGV